MIGKQNTGGFDFSRDMITFRIKGEIPVSFSKGAHVRIQKLDDRWHDQIGVVEFVSNDQPTVYGVRFQPTGGTGEYLHNELVGIGLPKPEKIEEYRDQSPEAIDMINTNKRWENELGDYINALRGSELDLDPKFVAVAVTHFQQGFMALTRAIARPESRLK